MATPDKSGLAPDQPGAGRALAPIIGGAALLLWPAALNGYPIVFSDTGAFLAQTVIGLVVWDKPYVFGPLLHAFHWRLSLWPPVLAQGLLLSWLLWLTRRMVAGQAAPGRHLLLAAGLASLTAAPWFATLLMPDLLAPALVLAMALLGFAGDRLSRIERLGLGLVAALAVAAHLSHLPVAAALVGTIGAARRAWRPTLGCALPLAAGLAVLLATNLIGHGRPAVSPYGAVFALARLVEDGPAARTIEAGCRAPASPGWHLCRWVGRLPTTADHFLWEGDGPVWAPRLDGAAPGGPISLAPEAAEIVRRTLVREPFAVLRAAAANTLAQLLRVRVGDALVDDHLTGSVARQLALGFPAAEQRRFAASLQSAGMLADAATPFLRPHRAVLLLKLLACLLGARRAAMMGDRRRLGLLGCVLVGVLANAMATGALSGPHDRYQARIAWLLPLAGALAVLPGGSNRAPNRTTATSSSRYRPCRAAARGETRSRGCR